jgi:hypothetical protein
MAVQPLRGFVHRRNRDLTHDAVCLDCHALVSVAWKPKYLVKAEIRHVCGVTGCDVSGLSPGFLLRWLSLFLVVTDPNWS